MIRVENITKKYQENVVLKNVSLDIERGKLTSIIGPNGAGKSTLLGLISRLFDSNGGDIFIGEKKIDDWKDNELAKKLAILKQNNSVDLRITIEELVSFGRFPYSGGRLNKEDHEMIDKAIKYMLLDDMREKYINELSGGERQRAFIAMIIAQDTDYILLDEPLNNLDIKHAKELMQTIRNLVDNLGKTVVLVIHDINFASVYSDIIIAMQDGEILQVGNTEDIISNATLDILYDTPMRIEKYNERKICIYY